MRSSTISLAVVLARLAAAQDNSSVPVPTINMFIDDGLDGDESYAASIVCAGASETIYALQCTDEGSVGVGSATCGPDAEVRSIAPIHYPPTFLPPNAENSTDFHPDSRPINLRRGQSDLNRNSGLQRDGVRSGELRAAGHHSSNLHGDRQRDGGRHVDGSNHDYPDGWHQISPL